MPVELTLTVDAQDNLIATCDGAQLAPPTPLASLPQLMPESNPYFLNPRGLGAQLYAPRAATRCATGWTQPGRACST